MVAQGSSVTPADINDAIAAIVSEATRREVVSSAGNRVQANQIVTLDDLKADLDIINAAHCYCQTNATIHTHAGGLAAAMSLQDRSPGDEVMAADMNAAITDKTTLAGKCGCHSVASSGSVCVCHTVCSCDSVCCNTVCWGICVANLPCYGQPMCGSNCSSVGTSYTTILGSAYGCACDTVCNCEFGG